MRVAVVGAGVSGLTCALELLRAGHEVTISTADLPEATTSAVAAAVWYPLRGERDERADVWLRAGLARFTTLSADPASTGVTLRGGIELFRHEADDDGWADLLPGFRHARPDELPDGFEDGFVAEGVPVIEMPLYLAYLRARVEVEGAQLRVRALERLDDVAPEADVIVNCAGLGARALCGDDSVTPVRGQVVRVAQFGLTRYLLDENNPDGMVYIYPRSRDVVCGGTREAGDRERAPRLETARAILSRCISLEPRIAGAEVVSHGVGLRPARPSVRLELAATEDGKPVVHNYGHGGSGVTLSWGCAHDVRALIDAL